MQLRALIEIWNSETLVYIHELPGCVASGGYSAAALEVLPDAVEAHLGWLASNGFALAANDVGIQIAEEHSGDDGGGPLFTADREPLSEEQLELALRIGALARRDLIDVYRSVSAVRRERPAPDGGWAIAEHLRHVAELDLAYTAPIVVDESAKDALPQDPVEALQASGRLVAERLRALAPDARGNVFLPVSGEAWTAGKVVRRMTAHLREHYPWVLSLARG